MRAVNICLPRARRILDFGCGVGWVLAEAHAEGSPVRIGLDYSMNALRGVVGGPQLRPDREKPSIEFVVGNGVNLPFIDEAFDVVVGHVSMPYMNTRGALREIYRVLAPGGSVFLTFHSFHFVRLWLLNAIRRRSYKEVIKCIYIAINGLLNHFSLPQSQAWWNRGYFETVNTPHGVFRAAQSEGFIMISTEHVVGRIFFASTARKLNAKSGAVLPAPGWATYCDLVR
jgi:SAM-dependent methyltransferase